MANTDNSIIEAINEGKGDLTERVEVDGKDEIGQLAENSNELVDYINNNVLPDYDGLVASGKQYNEDAIDGISTAVEESANGVSTAAMNTGELVRDINQIADEMDSNSEVANKLKKETEIFVNL